jgi:hypothetical protein
MRVNFTVTVQIGDGPEETMFVSSFPATDRVSSIVMTGERSVCATLKVCKIRSARIREYLGSSLFATTEFLS